MSKWEKEFWTLNNNNNKSLAVIGIERGTNVSILPFTRVPHFVTTTCFVLFFRFLLFFLTLHYLIFFLGFYLVGSSPYLNNPCEREGLFLFSSSSFIELLVHPSLLLPILLLLVVPRRRRIPNAGPSVLKQLMNTICIICLSRTGTTAITNRNAVHTHTHSHTHTDSVWLFNSGPLRFSVREKQQHKKHLLKHVPIAYRGGRSRMGMTPKTLFLFDLNTS
jgi:hypothetical protein